MLDLKPFAATLLAGLQKQPDQSGGQVMDMATAETIAEAIEAHYEQQVKDGLGVFFETNTEFAYKEAASIARKVASGTL